MKKSLLYFLLALLLCAGVFPLQPAPLNAEQGKTLDIESILPESTLFYAGIRNADEYGKAFENSALADILREKEVQAAIAEGKRVIAQLLEKAPNPEAQKGFGILVDIYEKLLKRVHGSASLVVCHDPDEKTPEGSPFPGLQICVALDLGKDAEAFMTDFKKIVSDIGAMGGAKDDVWKIFDRRDENANPEFFKEKRGESEIYSVVEKQKNISFSLTRHGQMFLAGFGVFQPSPVRKLMDNIDKAPAKSLASNERFKKGLGKLQTGKASSIAFVDCKAIFDRYLSCLPKEAVNAVEISGIRGIESLLACSSPDGKQSRNSSWLGLGEKREGIVKLLAPDGRKEMKSSSWVPGESMSYGAHVFEMDKIWAEARRIIKTASPKAMEEVDNFFAMARREIGVDVEDSVLNNFGGEMGAFAIENKGFLLSIPRVYLFAELKSPEKFDKLTDAILAKALQEANIPLKLQFKESEYAGAKYKSLQGIPFIFEFSPSWTYHNGFAVFALNTQDMKYLLKSIKDKKPVIKDDAKFKEAIQGLPTENLVGLSYNDTPRQFESSYSLIRGALGFVTNIPGFDVDFDMNVLPLPETITQHLKPSASVCVVEKDGYHSESRMTMDVSLGAPFAVGMISAIAIPNLLSSKKISNERTAPANLKAIHTAQTCFKEKLENDADEDENGEYGYLDELEFARQISMAVSGAGENSMAEKNGYYFKIFLKNTQDEDGADDNEEQFTCVAWPKKWDKTGNKCFFINEEGAIYALRNDDDTFSGNDNAPTLDDIYGEAWDNGSILEKWMVVR